MLFLRPAINQALIKLAWLQSFLNKSKLLRSATRYLLKFLCQYDRYPVHRPLLLFFALWLFCQTSGHISQKGIPHIHTQIHNRKRRPNGLLETYWKEKQFQWSDWVLWYEQRIKSQFASFSSQVRPTGLDMRAARRHFLLLCLVSYLHELRGLSKFFLRFHTLNSRVVFGTGVSADSSIQHFLSHIVLTDVWAASIKGRMMSFSSFICYIY